MKSRVALAVLDPDGYQSPAVLPWKGPRRWQRLDRCQIAEESCQSGREVLAWGRAPPCRARHRDLAEPDHLVSQLRSTHCPRRRPGCSRTSRAHPEHRQRTAATTCTTGRCRQSAIWSAARRRRRAPRTVCRRPSRILVFAPDHARWIRFPAFDSIGSQSLTTEPARRFQDFTSAASTSCAPASRRACSGWARTPRSSPLRVLLNPAGPPASIS